MANLASKVGIWAMEAAKKVDTEAHRALQSTLRIIHNSNNTIQGAISTRKMTMSLFKSFSSTVTPTISRSSSTNRQVKHQHLINSSLWAACLIKGRLRGSLRHRPATNYPKSTALTTSNHTFRRKARAASVSRTPTKGASRHSQANRPRLARTITNKSIILE